MLHLDAVLVRLPDGSEHEAAIDKARPAAEAILIQLAGVTTRDRADAMRGAVLCARRSAFQPLEEGEFYVCDLEGARVFARTEQEVTEVGRVVTLVTHPSVDVLVVDVAGTTQPLEVPLVEDYVERVDVVAREVVLRNLDALAV